MNIPTDRTYSETHEWYRVEDDVVIVGITQYATDELTDITYVELPEVGTAVEAGNVCVEIESVKATAELLCAVSGKVTEVNTELVDRPELLNEDAFDEGWIIKVKTADPTPLNELMSARDYRKFIGE